MKQSKWLKHAAIALALMVPLSALCAEEKERGVGDVV